jgi:hypothetical protein
VLVAALVVGLLLRVAWAIYAARSVPEFLVSGDQYSYWVLGQEIGNGRGYRIPPFTTPTSYYPVGFPALLGAITWLTLHTPLPDSSILATATLQIVMGVATAALVWFVADRTWGRRVANVAAWLMALWPNAVMAVATYSLETTFTALVLASVAVLVGHDWSTGRAPSTQRLVVFGVVFAATMLVRPFALPVLVGLALAVWRSGAGTRTVLRSVAIPVLVVLLAMVPWTLRNARALDAFVPVSTNLGDTMCLDRTLDANGTFRFAIHEGCADPALPEVERNGANIRKALSFVAHHPVKEVSLWGMRLYRMMEHDRVALREVEENGAGRFLPDWLRSGLGLLADLWFYAVGVLALVGVATTRRQLWATAPRVVFLATSVGLLLIPLGLWGAPRFHVPLAPFMAVMAAVTLSRLRQPEEAAQAPTGVS